MLSMSQYLEQELLMLTLSSSPGNEGVACCPSPSPTSVTNNMHNHVFIFNVV